MVACSAGEPPMVVEVRLVLRMSLEGDGVVGFGFCRSLWYRIGSAVSRAGSEMVGVVPACAGAMASHPPATMLHAVKTAYGFLILNVLLLVGLPMTAPSGERPLRPPMGTASIRSRAQLPGTTTEERVRVADLQLFAAK